MISYQLSLYPFLIALTTWMGPGSPELPPAIARFIELDRNFLVGYYQDLHRHPELSLHEVQTSATLARTMEEAGFEVATGIGGNGVVAMLRNGKGPMILYRTDMDALPITERTELPYASRVEAPYLDATTGVMHACGHDVHMSTWVGVGRTMANHREYWRGTLMMIAQPAEETGQGARMMLDAGLYERFGVPDMGIAMHTNASAPAGTVILDPGYTMARAESMTITVFGKGGHGAEPHRTIDPIVVASMLVLELQTIVSRSVPPTEAAVITVGAIDGGVKYNIIPESVELKLTIRTFTDETRDLVHRRIAEVCRGVAIAAGLSEDQMPRIALAEGDAPPNYNNPVLVSRLLASAAKIVGEDNIMHEPPRMVAEDFALYGRTKEHVPTALFMIGTVSAERFAAGVTPGLHTADYFPDPEGSLRTGVTVVVQMLLDLFQE